MIGKLLATTAKAATGGAFPYAAALGFAGELIRNKEARKASARQMAFQEDMSNTSYQRAMADMKAAGLNPILAGKVGGASTPSGSTYQPGNMIEKAANTQFAVANANNMIQQERLNRQNADYFDRKPYGSAVLNARPMNILLTEALENNPELIEQIVNSPKKLLGLLSGDFSIFGDLFKSNSKDEVEEPKITLKPGNMPIKKPRPVPKVKNTTSMARKFRNWYNKTELTK